MHEAVELVNKTNVVVQWMGLVDSFWKCCIL